MLDFSLPSSHRPSYAYLCPECGELWARVRCGGTNWSCGKWTPFPAGCPAHPRVGLLGDKVPGSLLQPFVWWEEIFQSQLATALRLLPGDWLQWEFEQHLKQFEQEATNV